MENNGVKEIERIVQQGLTVNVDGREFSAHNMKPVMDMSTITSIRLSTLTGLNDYLDNNLDGLNSEKMFIVVTDYASVQLLLAADVKTKLRQSPVEVILDREGKDFPFGRFMAVDDFIIKLSSMFMETPDLATILQYVSRLTVDNSIQTEDDGVSQKAIVKRGISAAFKDLELAPSRATLQPIRTFTEVVQPKSSFIFRMKPNGDSMPTCALFEADGGAWKSAAAANIKTWLLENIKDINVVA